MKKPKKMKKSELAAIGETFNAGLDAGQMIMAGKVEHVLVASNTLKAAGLGRYSDALLEELELEMIEVSTPSPVGCPGGDCGDCQFYTDGPEGPAMPEHHSEPKESKNDGCETTAHHHV